MAGGADPGEPGPDDQDVHVLRRHDGASICRSVARLRICEMRSIGRSVGRTQRARSMRRRRPAAARSPAPVDRRARAGAGSCTPACTSRRARPIATRPAPDQAGSADQASRSCGLRGAAHAATSVSAGTDRSSRAASSPDGRRTPSTWRADRSRRGAVSSCTSSADGFDLRVLNERERQRFKRIVGIRRSGWYGRAAPSEWFADGYATCGRKRPAPCAAAHGVRVRAFAASTLASAA